MAAFCVSVQAEPDLLQPDEAFRVSARRVDARVVELEYTVSYQRRIKDLMLVMADDELKDSVETIPVNKEVPLWKEGRLILVAKYMDGEVVGEKYRLTNVSPSEMLLVEQELYRRGVRAIAVEHHTLMQGDGTDIYIVRERKDNE
uniref:TraK domain-containing protein n=1 Tax=Pseudomonas aeruginosa TaxID=287 RepID=UPI001E2BC400|nr:type-F conjugative transfer system secretin TraK [Pseudomonas aeruginosa]